MMISRGRTNALCGFLWFLGFFAFFAGSEEIRSEAAIGCAKSDLEVWIVAQLSNGVPAHVLDYKAAAFSTEISAAFLISLFTATESGQLGGLYLDHAVVTNELELVNKEVPRGVELNHCTFSKPVHLVGNRFRRSLVFRNCSFRNTVIFEHMDVDDHLDLSGSEFAAQFRCTPVRIGGGLTGNGVYFGGPADFSYLKVGLSAQFNEDKSVAGERDPMFRMDTRTAVFAKDCNFEGAIIGKAFVMAKAHLSGSANFKSLKVGTSAYIGWSVFGDQVDFSFGETANDFNAEHAVFQSTNRAKFYGVKIGGQAIFDEVLFGGAVDFGDAMVEKNMEAFGARFTNPDTEASFFGMKVAGSAFFTNTVFAGPVNFILGQISGNFEVEGSSFNNESSVSRLTEITTLRPLHFNADFGSLKVGGFAVFANADFTGTVSFRNAEFQNLHLENVDFGHGTNSVQMEGLMYRHIRAVAPRHTNHLARIEQHASWENLKDILVNNVNFSADAYERVEEYFRRVGEHDLADEVFIQRRRQEMKDPDLSWPTKAWSHVLDWVVGYGKEPSRALGFGVIVILLGSFVFRPEKMCSSKHALKCCNSFWYSVDLFVPGIDLHVADDWHPEMPQEPYPVHGRARLLWRLRRWRWYYVRLHKSIGWVLIPLGLASILGIVK